MIKCYFENGVGIISQNYTFSIKGSEKDKYLLHVTKWQTCKYVRLVAIGEDCRKIYENFLNIRKVQNDECQCTWFGDEAKFILWNLLDLIKLGYFENE